MNRCAEHPRGDPCPLLPEWAQAQIATLQSQLAEREAELKRRELKIQQLTLELAHHRRIRFGARSEVLGAEQRELFLDNRAEDGKRPATPSPPGSPNSEFVSTPNDVDTNSLQFLLNSASAYACPAVGQ